MPHVRRIGTEAEDRAAEFLVDNGFTLITRRYRAAAGEVDLIALEGEVLAFVEVRLRRHPGFSPEASVGRRKQERIFAAARAYLTAFPSEDREVRYDLVAITPKEIRLHRDAFRP